MRGPLVALLVAQNPEVVARSCRLLDEGLISYHLEAVESWEAARTWLFRYRPHLVLVGGEVLPKALPSRLRPSEQDARRPPVVVVDLEPSVERARRAYVLGAADYLPLTEETPQALQEGWSALERLLRRYGMIPPKGRILIVDDSPEILTSLASILENEGYQVFTATSPALAETLYQQERVHLAVIDVRLEGGDEEDVSGLDLAQRMDPVVPCIILTSYPSIEGVRRALREIGAVDYLVKAKGETEDLLQAINAAFAERVRINQRMQIEWGAGTSLVGLVASLKDFRAAPWEERRRAAEELEELFRRLFPNDVRRLRIEYMAPGRGGSGVVLARPFYDRDLEGEPVVIKFGRRDNIERERRNYFRYVAPFAGLRATQLRGEMARTLRLGGLLFSFIGQASGTPRDFLSYYRDPNVSSEQVCQTLRDLFEETCARWYQGKQRWVAQRPDALARDLERRLGLDQPSKQRTLVEVVAHLLDGRPHGGLTLKPAGAESLEVHWRGQHRELPNPVHFIRHRRDRFPLPSYQAITHGDLHGRNLFVDEDGRAWLIDFFHTGWGPLIRDFAELESVVKFDLLDLPDLVKRYALEQALLAPRRFGWVFNLPPKVPPLIRRAYVVIQTLRQQVHRWTDTWETTEYEVGLLYYALKVMVWATLRDQDLLAPIRARHALLSAALICEKLRNRPPTADRRPRDHATK